MGVVLSVVALIGLIIFIVGALMWLIVKPSQPNSVILMVVGGVVFAVAHAIILLIALF